MRLVVSSLINEKHMRISITSFVNVSDFESSMSLADCFPDSIRKELNSIICRFRKKNLEEWHKTRSIRWLAIEGTKTIFSLSYLWDNQIHSLLLNFSLKVESWNRQGQFFLLKLEIYRCYGASRACFLMTVWRLFRAFIDMENLERIFVYQT